MTYACKAMIRNGFSLNSDGFWIELQLSETLQIVIVKHLENFNGAVFDPKNFQEKFDDQDYERVD